jgi:hypothetical protein
VVLILEARDPNSFLEWQGRAPLTMIMAASRLDAVSEWRVSRNTWNLRYVGIKGGVEVKFG